MADEPKIELINDKWQNILPQYESNRFDLAIVDPPYAVGAADGSFGNRGYDSKTSDLKPYANADKTPGKHFFEEIKRVSKNQIIWGFNYYPQHLEHSGAIVWHKKVHGPLSDCEIAYQSFNKVVNYYYHEWMGFMKGEETGKTRIHPNQKPVALYRWLLSKYAKPGDTILDTHLGSGSNAIAAWQKKHDFVGIECDTEYYDAMLHRFKMNTNREYTLEAWQKQSENKGQQTIFSN